VGCGAADRPPFWAGFQLAGWTVGHYGLLAARVTQAGQDPRGLDGRQLVDWAYGVALDTARHPNEALWRTVTRVEEALAQPPWPDREFWGSTPEAQRAQRAMADLAGGPAPMRE